MMCSFQALLKITQIEFMMTKWWSLLSTDHNYITPVVYSEGARGLMCFPRISPSNQYKTSGYFMETLDSESITL